MTSFSNEAGEARTPLNSSNNPEAATTFTEEIELVESLMDAGLETVPPENIVHGDGSDLAYVPAENGQSLVFGKKEIYVNNRPKADSTDHHMALATGEHFMGSQEEVALLLDINDTKGTVDVYLKEGDGDLEPIKDLPTREEVVGFFEQKLRTVVSAHELNKSNETKTAKKTSILLAYLAFANHLRHL
jgi:hypothetical protein